jgi:hypothetical protein
MKVTHDLNGLQFGRLCVIRENGRLNKRAMWLCKCECGNEVTLSSNRLLHKKCGTKSCGCLRNEKAKERATKHGLSKSPIYTIWESMRKRCNNPNAKRYDRYGGRGIEVCERWNDFKNFHDDMIEGHHEGLTIDRIDNDGNYEPSNCRWATQQEQMSNYSRNVFITIKGETDTVKNMCIKYNIPYDKTVRRIKRGMDPLTAFTAVFRNGTNEIISESQLIK